jgi:hypothetical protein
LAVDMVAPRGVYNFLLVCFYERGRKPLRIDPLHVNPLMETS